jgi:hypothetical protein
MVARSSSGMPVDEPVVMAERPVMTPAWLQYIERLHARIRDLEARLLAAGIP